MAPSKNSGMLVDVLTLNFIELLKTIAMINKRTITGHIKNLLRDKFIIYTEKVSNSLDLKKDLNIENSELNVLFFYLENIFKIEIGQSEEKSVQKVGDLSRIVYGKLSSQAA